MSMIAEKAPVMRMRHISKRFDATQALDNVSLDVYPGEVHALVGENGAGKSTLIKIMTGVHQPDTGEIILNGKPVQVRNSQEAQVLGIAAIYQEPMIYPDLSVAENIFISHRDLGAVMRWGRIYTEAEAVLARLDVRLNVRMSNEKAIRMYRMAGYQSAGLWSRYYEDGEDALVMEKVLL